MSNNPLDPNYSFQQTSQKAIEAIKGYFPDGKFEGKHQSLVLKNVMVDDNLENDDFVAQQEVKEKDGTWAVPLKATFDLMDNKTGKVVDTKQMVLAKIPKITPRFSYIVDGKERQVDHQSLLKRGMFTRVADNGQLETRFNTKTPSQHQTQFQVFFDPDSHEYRLKMQDTEVPIMPVLQALGTSEKDMKDAWGAQVYNHNQTTTEDATKHLKRLYRNIYRKDTDDAEELRRGVRDHFHSLSLDPKVTKMVVDKEHPNVDAGAMISATKALLDVNRGDKKPTGYDDLRFKEIRHTDDFIAERIRESAKTILPKLKNNIDRAERVDQVVNNNVFGRPVKSFFTNSQLATLGDQTNPLGMITGHTKHTIMGEHGISDAHQVTLDAKIIHPSSYGFLDPVHTPESSRTGIALQIPLGAWKEDGELKTRVINARTGKEEVVSATQLASSNVAFPDQFKLQRDKPPQPLDKTITVADKNGQTASVNPKQVDYVFMSHANLFSATTNLIPFLQNNNGNRVGYGTQQAHQALALTHREEPLVQSAMLKTPAGTAASPVIGAPQTFEQGIGQMMGHAAKTSGVVAKIDENYIYVKGGKDGKQLVRHALYNHFPTNNKKGELHSTPLVQVGDEVKVGQPLADHSFTKNGKLALGTNLRVGYVPAEGYNFEDGVVISESAAKKLTSDHLYKKELEVGSDNWHIGTKKFVAQDQVRYTVEQLKPLGAEGVIAVGARVKPGDPLVLALKKNEVLSEAEGLSRVSKGMVKDWRAEPIEWDGDTEGVVTKVIRANGKVKVHVSTQEPMAVGDKLVGRHGNKGICTQIRPDSEMPHYVDPVTGEKTNLQVMLNPLGVPGRINAGQLLETSASLIARKTGQPYMVKNFDSSVPDWTEKIEQELEQHGLKPKTMAIDPKTNEPIGEIHLGEQYMLKLDQQVSKKMSARGAGYGNPYDGNKTATTGGGRLGSLGNFAMLAHGALHNLHEMQTIKTSFDDETWRAIQTGQPLPTPKPSYAYEKFDSYLKGMGVNIRKDGNELVLEPLTDKDITRISNGEVKDAGRMLRGKDLRAESGGLFDPNIFGKDAGGLKGEKWGHITLDTAMPNPIFEEPILKLTGLKQNDFENILAGKQEHNGLTGPHAIGAMLDNISVKDELTKLRKEIDTAHPTKVDNLNKRIRYLQNLDKMNLTPREAYMRTKIPVLPPIIRPVSEMGDGSLNTDDLNGLYRGVGLVNKQLKGMDKDLKSMPEESGKLYSSLYDGLKALTGVGTLPSYHQAKRDKLQGLMNKVEGPIPKLGFFQSKVMSRKQDMSMRSTIVPNQEITLDQIALPREGALKMYEPHLIRELRNVGMTTLSAKEAIKKNDPMVDKVLERVMAEVPVLAKRDPVLHKFGVQAFKPVLAKGSAIEIHPLVVGGFNADFDGNCVLGDSKIVLTFFVKDVISVLEPLVKEDSEMKFLYDSIVMGAVDGSRKMEIEIQQVPYNKAAFTTDKNGAKVHPVLVPFYVYSYDSTTGKESFEPVTHVTVEEGCEVFRVETARGWYVDASGNESLAVFDHEAGEMIRSPATEESIGKFCAILPPVDLGGEFSFDEGWAIGSFVSDGFFMGGSRVGYAKLSEAHREKMASIIQPTGRRTYHHGNEDSFGEGAKDHYKSLPDRWIALFSACYAEGAEEGRAALRKRLPPTWKTMSSEGRWGLLSGLLDGDGSLSISNAGKFTVQISTSSSYLVDDIIALCQSLGVRASSSVYKAQSSGNAAYIVNLSVVDIRANAGHVVLVNPKKADNLRKMLEREMTDDRDQIPVTERELRLLLSLDGIELKSKKSLQTILSKKRGAWALQRSVVQQRLSEAASLPEELFSLKARAYSDVQWDRVSSVRERGRHTVYDLVVPTTKVFAVNYGLVVWDTMAVFAPVSKAAIQEAHRMLPSKNLINPTDNKLIPMPSQDAMVGAFMFTRLGARTSKSFADEKEARTAYERKELRHDDVIKVSGKDTTVGRLLMDRSLPASMRGRIAWAGGEVTKKSLEGLMRDMIQKSPNDIPSFLQSVKDYGNKAAFKQGLTISLGDMKVNKTLRDKVFADAKKKEEEIRSMPGLSQKERESRVVELYKSKLDTFDAALKEDLNRRGSSMMTMINSGGMSKWVQVKQLTGAPVMFEDAHGDPVPVPVLRSYSEGLRLADFMTAAHGARMGTLSKSQGTSEPGFLSKKIVNSTIGITVADNDCGTKKGVHLGVDDPDLLDRYLSEDVVAGKGRVLKKNTLVTPEIRDTLRSNKLTRIPVRSPLKCGHGDGVCAKCAGVSDNGKDYAHGTAIGVISAQALGEPATQMAMNAFHSGGVIAAGQRTIKGGAFQSAKDLLDVKKTMPNAARLAPAEGKITNIKKDPAGGFRVTIQSGDGMKEAYTPELRRGLSVGSFVKAGDPLSDGVVNPHELLPLAGLDAVKQSLTDQLSGAYGNTRKRHVELVVRSLTDTAKVEDTGGRTDIVRGDVVSAARLAQMNAEDPTSKIKYSPMLKGVNYLPLQSDNWAAKMNFNRLRETVMTGAAMGHRSDIHGSNPLPGIMYGAEFGKPKPGGKGPF